MPNQLPHIDISMQDALFMIDPDGRIEYVNEACKGIFGYCQDEMIGRALFDFLLPEDYERTRKEARRVMGGCTRAGFENRYVRKDGRIVDIRWFAYWAEADQLRVGIARDITERKRTEALLPGLPVVCSQCPDQRTGSSDECLACPQFQNQFINPDYTPHVGNPLVAAGYRPMRLIGVSVVCAGVTAAILDLTLIGSSLVFLGFGLCLADLLSSGLSISNRPRIS